MFSSVSPARHQSTLNATLHLHLECITGLSRKKDFFEVVSELFVMLLLLSKYLNAITERNTRLQHMKIYLFTQTVIWINLPNRFNAH